MSREVTIGWPRKLGGPAHGEPYTAPPPGARTVTVITPRPTVAALLREHDALPSVNDGIGYDKHLYVDDLVRLTVDGNVLTVRVQRYSQLTQADATWQLMCEAFGVTEALR